MSSNFPAALDNIATDKSNATVTADDHPAHHNQMAAAINAVQHSLGAGLVNVFQVNNRFNEIAEDEIAKVQARQNLGVQIVDGGTFN